MNKIFAPTAVAVMIGLAGCGDRPSPIDTAKGSEHDEILQSVRNGARRIICTSPTGTRLELENGKYTLHFTWPVDKVVPHTAANAMVEHASTVAKGEMLVREKFCDTL